MHELTIASQILKIVKNAAGTEQEKDICRINLAIGRLTGIQPDCLDFAFQVLTKGTPMENAAIEIEFIKPEFRCTHCFFVFTPEEGYFSACSNCGKFGSDILKGQELHVVSIDLI